MSQKIDKLLANLETARDEAPDKRQVSRAPQPQRTIQFRTGNGIPKRYREADWRPDNCERWKGLYEKARNVIKAKSILSLVGGRGTGKTRLAIEVARRVDAIGTEYLTAMDVFLGLQASYRKDSSESELSILKKLGSKRILIIDEVQERGNTEWEDRILTHLIDKRYGAMLPTILIANLKPEELSVRLGPSIMDRMHEGGGLLEVTGQSFRKK